MKMDDEKSEIEIYVAPDVEEVISLEDLDQERLYAGGVVPPPMPTGSGAGPV